MIKLRPRVRVEQPVARAVLYRLLFHSSDAYFLSAQLAYATIALAVLGLMEPIGTLPFLLACVTVTGLGAIGGVQFALELRRERRRREDYGEGPAVPSARGERAFVLRYATSRGTFAGMIRRWLDIGGDLYLVVDAPLQTAPRLSARTLLRPKFCSIRVDRSTAYSDEERTTLAKICALVPRTGTFQGSEAGLSRMTRRVLSVVALSLALVSAWLSGELPRVHALRDAYTQSRNCTGREPGRFVATFCTRESAVALHAELTRTPFDLRDHVTVTLRDALGIVEYAQFPATPDNVRNVTPFNSRPRHATLTRFGARVVSVTDASEGFAAQHSPIDFELAVDRALLLCSLLGFGSILFAFLAHWSIRPIQRSLASPLRSRFL